MTSSDKQLICQIWSGLVLELVNNAPITPDEAEELKNQMEEIATAQGISVTITIQSES
jgi:predicted ATP-dependent Lon-type protease